jgi:hypothetical protein
MRTTVTLDPDTEFIVRERMRRRGVSFKQAVNDAIRDGALTTKGGRAAFRTATFELGTPAVSLDRALQVAAAFEDDESLHKLELGK